MGGWLMLWSGLTNGSGPQYLFWSGIFADLTIFAAAAVMAWRAVHAARAANCHTHGCWRVGTHPVDGTPWKTCRRHHPDPVVRDGLGAHHIRAAWHTGHAAAQGGNNDRSDGGAG